MGVIDTAAVMKLRPEPPRASPDTIKITPQRFIHMAVAVASSGHVSSSLTGLDNVVGAQRSGFKTVPLPKKGNDMGHHLWHARLANACRQPRLEKGGHALSIQMLCKSPH